MFEVPESDIIGVKVDEHVISGEKPVEYIRTTEKKTEDKEQVEETAENIKAFAWSFWNEIYNLFSILKKVIVQI